MAGIDVRNFWYLNIVYILTILLIKLYEGKYNEG